MVLMGYKPVTLNENDFTGEELKKLDELIGKRKLSATITLALKEYLHRFEIKHWVKSQQDIYQLIETLKKEHPEHTNLEYENTKNALLTELTKGQFYITAEGKVVRE